MLCYCNLVYNILYRPYHSGTCQQAKGCTHVYVRVSGNLYLCVYSLCCATDVMLWFVSHMMICNDAHCARTMKSLPNQENNTVIVECALWDGKALGYVWMVGRYGEVRYTVSGIIIRYALCGTQRAACRVRYAVCSMVRCACILRTPVYCIRNA